MRVRAAILIALVLLVLGSLVGTATATEPSQEGELIVVLEPGVATAGSPAAAAVHARADGRAINRIEEMNLDVVAVDDVDAAIAEYQARPEVKYVEINGQVTASAVDDPLYDLQWHLQAKSGSNKGTANVEPAWSRSTGKGVTVAVVDTGVRDEGSDLAASRITAGYDFVNNDSNPDDDHSKGHGTHIAGTIAQSTDNDKGVAGVAPRAKIMPVKVLNSVGVGSYSDVIDGMVYAVNHGADVINLSLSGNTYSQALCDAVADAADDAVVVAATGNEGVTAVSYPAACDGAVGVGAVRYDGTLAPYSNSGAEVDLVAPGGDSSRDQNGDGYEDSILQQTRNDGTWGYWWFEGTSMAAAHVSGVAALVLSVEPSANVPKVLKSTARDAGSASLYGAGIVDAAAAVDQAKPRAKGDGYWLAARAGDVYSFGGVTDQSSGSAPSQIVAIEATPSSDGYWLLDSAGGVHTSGDARYYGSIPGLRNKGVNIGEADPIDIGTSPTGSGYWILDSAGGIFTFGDADYFGSIPAMRQQGHDIGKAKVMDLASTPTGKGYWILDDKGGMFTFGDASYHGSIPAMRRDGVKIGQANAVAMTPTVSGEGYWLTDDKGGVFTFGDASYQGSIPAMRRDGVKIGDANVVAMVPTKSGGGYWQVDDAGGIFTFGDAAYHGSMPGIGAPGPAVGMAASQ